MPNVASFLKTEISRVARKEVRAEIETLKKASVAYRSSIAELRRQVSALEKELRRVAKGATHAVASPGSSDEATGDIKRRFSATRLAAHRSKLGLSAASYGQLVGVSGQTIYHWEQGKARPRVAQLESLAGVRGLNAREIAERPRRIALSFRICRPLLRSCERFLMMVAEGKPLLPQHAAKPESVAIEPIH